MDDNHEHAWGPVEYAHFTGNPHRKCRVDDCNFVTLDLEDDDPIERLYADSDDPREI